MVTERVADVPAISDEAQIAEQALCALDELDAPGETSAQPWSITDAGGADWAARKLVGVRARRAEVRTLAQRQRSAILDAIAPHLQAIDDWANEEEGRLSGEESHWEALLGAYHRSVLAESPRTKTIRLPHGTLVARKQPDTWQTDDAVVIEWARKNTVDIVRTKVEVDRREMKAAISIAPNGVAVWGDEMVPGVTVTPGDVRFSVETEEEGK